MHTKHSLYPSYSSIITTKKSMLTDYQKRSSEHGGFCSPQQLQQALADPNTIVLDTRTPEELQQGDGQQYVQHVNYKNIPMYTRDACPELSNNIDAYIPKEADKTVVPILIYCRSGGRAATVKKILIEKGYLHVLNAGGYNDVIQHMKQEKS